MPAARAWPHVPGNASLPCSRGATLQLSGRPELIPTHDLSHVSLPLPRGLDDGLFALSSWQLPQGFPSDLTHHPAARQLLDQCIAGPALSGEVWDQVHVFTDGSFDGSRSSWAFCVFGL